MNKIQLIKQEFPKVFTRKYEELGNPPEGTVIHSKYGGRNTNCRSFLYTLVKIIKPKNILELGSWRYQSSDIMALALDELGIDGRVDSFDVIKGGYDAKERGPAYPKNPKVKPHFWRKHHTNYDTFMYDDPNIVYKDFKSMSNDEIYKVNKNYLLEISPDEGYQLLIIDGDHSAESIYYDVEYCYSVANSDSIYVIDDLYEDRLPDVRKAFDEMNFPKYDFSDWNDNPDNPLISDGVFQIA